MITGPFEFIIGAADLDSTAAFLRVFGFDRAHDITIDSSAAIRLYGYHEARHQRVLSSSATDTQVRLVQTDRRRNPMQAFEAGGHGIDFYTTNIEAAVDFAAKAGGSRPEPVSWTIDTGRRLTEARIVAPDGSFAVFCVSYSAGGIPTILDQDASRLFSEVTLTSWIIPADRIEREFEFWGNVVGYRNIRRTMLSKEAMVDLMQLPRQEAMGCSMYADERPHCPVDLLWYPDLELSLRDDWPLKPGLFALGFKTTGGEGAEAKALLDRSSRVQVSDPQDGATDIYAGRSPGGIRFHLHQ